MQFKDFLAESKEKLQDSWIEFCSHIDRTILEVENDEDAADFEILDICHFFDDVENCRIDYGIESAFEAINRWIAWENQK